MFHTGVEADSFVFAGLLFQLISFRREKIIWGTSKETHGSTETSHFWLSVGAPPGSSVVPEGNHGSVVGVSDLDGQEGLAERTTP